MTWFKLLRLGFPAIISMSALLAFGLPPRPAAADYSMFPPPDPSTSVVNINNQGFTINGQAVFLTCGSMHYERVPRQLWADRLMRMKQAGFNTVETYVFWNYQEPHPDQFDFTGQHDLAAFLALAKQMGFYVFLRVGPYDNGEWDSGGLPVWLRFIPGMDVRDSDKPFMDALDQYFDKLLPIVAANQISRGGPIILMQLENEGYLQLSDGYLRKLGATEIPNAYFDYLYNKPHTMGINLPMFFNGLNQGFSPAGYAPIFVSTLNSPWFTSEMWTGWFSSYRQVNPYVAEQHRGDPHLETSIWRVIAYGGAGYNLFMAVGGTNFDNWNCDQVQSSYDFGAPIGQTGDLRPMYYSYKLANYFARTFEQILATSHNVIPALSFIPGGVFACARSSPNGVISFLENRSYEPIVWQAAPQCSITLNPNDMFPVVQNFTINSTFMLTNSYTKIFGILQQGATTTLVIYGDPGQEGQLQIGVAPGQFVAGKSDGFTADVGGLQYTLNVTFPQSGPQAYQLQTQKMGELTGSKQILRVLVESTSEAQRTWFMSVAGKPSVVCGPEYVSDSADIHGVVTLRTEREIDSNDLEPTLIYGSDPDPIRLALSSNLPDPSLADLMPPQLGPWQVLDADGPAAPGYDDSQWLSTPVPLAMGADDYNGDYEWYRTTITVSKPGNYTLQMPAVRDYGIVFVNGIELPSPGTSNASRILVLKQGANTLAILTVSEGRNKLYRFSGPFNGFNDLGAKGILAPVNIQPTDSGSFADSSVAMTTWRMHGGLDSPDVSTGWTPYSKEPNVPCYYRSSFDWHKNPNGVDPVLRVAWGNLSSGFVLLNGHNLGRYPDSAMPMGIYLPPCWLNDGQNSLVILDEQGQAPDGVRLVVERIASHQEVLLHPVPGVSGQSNTTP
jgi:beta-galactosidase